MQTPSDLKPTGAQAKPRYFKAHHLCAKVNTGGMHCDEALACVFTQQFDAERDVVSVNLNITSGPFTLSTDLSPRAAYELAKALTAAADDARRVAALHEARQVLA